MGNRFHVASDFDGEDTPRSRENELRFYEDDPERDFYPEDSEANLFRTAIAIMAALLMVSAIGFVMLWRFGKLS